LKKKTKKRKTHGKSKSKTSKLKKNRTQNKWGKKGTSKRKKNGKMDLSICIFFAYILLFRFVFLGFCFAFLLFFSRQKAK